ncbi:hypothetical protein Angca_001714, partial [Angiostrongylus cantonensis]
MTLREQKSDSTQLFPADSAHFCFNGCRIPSEQKNGYIAKMENDFRSESADRGAVNVNQLEMHLPCFNASQIFERQDSLARAATLQECDRTRDPDGILDFLETTMNIEDYLEDINSIEIPADDIDLEDFELQKCKNDQMTTNDTDDSFAHNDCIPGHLFSTAFIRKTSEVKHDASEIKLEPEWDDNCPSTSSTRTSKRERRNVKVPEIYTPTRPPRKYTLKTPQERNNTSYKVKRQRNNDAVRKSRTKAKQLQLMKEKQLE